MSLGERNRGWHMRSTLRKLWSSLQGVGSGAGAEPLAGRRDEGVGTQTQKGQNLMCHPLALSEVPGAQLLPPPSSSHGTAVHFSRSPRSVSPLEAGNPWRATLRTGCTRENRAEPCEADLRNLGFGLPQEPSGTHDHP